MNRYSQLNASAAMCALLLSGCGGGGDSTQAASVPPPETEPVAQSQGIEGGGSVRSFGLSADSSVTSVFLGGTELVVTDPSLEVSVDGEPATVAELQVGDQVSFQGVSNDGGNTVIVSSLEQDDLVEGPIDAGSIDLAQSQFSVLGQTIQVIPLTLFDDDISPADLSSLSAGDFVEVSGVVGADNAILATRIELEDDDDDFEVNGTITSVDLPNFLLSINGLTVDFSSAELEDFDGADPAVGDFVEIEGESFDVNGFFIAESVEREDEDFGGDEGDLVSLEGIVTAVLSEQAFELNGQSVTLGADVEFDDGDANDIGVGVQLQVEGALTSDGVLVATEIEFDDDPSIEIFASIDALDPATQTVQVLGINVQVLANTRLDDDGDADLPVLTFADLAIGDFVDILGTVDINQPGSVIATLLEREQSDGDDPVELQARIESLNDPEFVVLGLTVVTTPDTDFEDDGDFFNAAMVGDLVEIEGSFDGNVLTATEIEMEDD